MVSVVKLLVIDIPLKAVALKYSLLQPNRQPSNISRRITPLIFVLGKPLNNRFILCLSALAAFSTSATFQSPNPLTRTGEPVAAVP